MADNVPTSMTSIKATAEPSREAEARDVVTAYFDAHGINDARGGGFNIVERLKAAGLFAAPAGNGDVREALLAAKEHFDAEFSDSCDLPHKNRISKLCDKVDAGLAELAQPREAEPVAWMHSEHVEAYRTGKRDGMAWASPDKTEFYDVALCTLRAPSPRVDVPGGREEIVEECLQAARRGFEESMRNYVLIGPSGMAMAMINAIRALKPQDGGGRS